MQAHAILSEVYRFCAIGHTHDRGDKRQAYQSLPSLRDYILVSETEMKVWIEHSDTEKITILDAPEDTIAIPGLEFSISLQELYA